MLTAILIGPPGSGKSSVGRALGQRLKLPFTDTDILIEKKCQKAISEIFIEDGEPHFREIERAVVLDQLAIGNGILSLGGGSVLDPLTHQALSLTAAPIVFLDVSLSSASPRVGFNRDRPLLLGNPRAKWQELMNVRRPIYEGLADITILTDELSPTQVSQKIVEILDSHKAAQ
jgi:shikimate kinase